MTNQDNPVSFKIEHQIGVITINYPPVNALGYIVRQGLVTAIEQLEFDTDCKVIIIQCLGKTFIAGADISEFGSAPIEPHLPDVVNRIEACQKPVVASMFGTSLGGGLEVALACHYRVALSNSKIGLPEVNLGLIPGAGGTQRLMRLTGIGKALEMITSGTHYQVTSLEETGLFDAIFKPQSDNFPVELQELTKGFCQQLLDKEQTTIPRVGERNVNGNDFDWDVSKVNVTKKARGLFAPLVAFYVLKNTWNKNISVGMAIEREQFLKLKNSEQSAALRHVFAAEKKAPKFESRAESQEINKVGIVGGGTMGRGIGTAFLMAGFSVCITEQTESATEAAYQGIKSNLDANVKRGRMDQHLADRTLQELIITTDKNQLNNCQLIIEAVFEDIDVKIALFKELDDICDKTTIFATNTSYLDINEIAEATKYPQRVVGMHFFSPAHIMKLLEVVRAEKSSEAAITTAMQVGKRLNKVAVLVKVCFGFAGNRMYSRYGREIQQMLLEGAKVEQIDRAMTDWGMAMGPLAVQDLSGIDIGYNARKSRPFPKHDPGYFKAAATLVENGRLGRKTGAGFYCYVDGKPQIDQEVDRLITSQARELGFQQRTFSNDEIVHRALFALISSGLQLFNEGIVQKHSDIDVIWLFGYGFPRYRGGPMFQAQLLGSEKLKTEMEKLRSQFGEEFWPEVNY